jgi:hypothetical protein
MLNRHPRCRQNSALGPYNIKINLITGKVLFMRRKLSGLILIFALLAGVVWTGGTAAPTQAGVDPVDLVSAEHMLTYIDALTAIQPYSGWRNSASSGEREARDYVAATLGDMDYLNGLGMTVTPQEFNVLTGVEIWEAQLILTIGGQPVEIPANALRGPRWDLKQALRYDSDGAFNDSIRNPVIVDSADVLLVLSDGDLQSASRQNLDGKILIVNYELVDRSILGIQPAAQNAWGLVQKNPAGIVLVTQYSNQIGESHGTFVGDVSAFDYVQSSNNPPVLYARIEDMAGAGIAGWDDLDAVEAARMTWDVDVFAPGKSGNMIAYLPGQDSSKAVILGAHIDSPNSPGAMDDGSGSASLLEVAHVLNESQTQPAVDLYLVWYGSEELGLYGSQIFAATHQDLLDRTLAVLNLDCLTHPLDTLKPALSLNTWSFARLGDDSIPWPDYLAGYANALNIKTRPADLLLLEADNSSYAGFGVPQTNVIYEDTARMDAVGGVHYAGHLHDPYDTVDLARLEQDTLADMARIAVIAALKTGEDQPVLRVTPEATRRAVIVGSHSESPGFSPTIYADFSMALLMAGMDVDLIPYGEPVTAETLDNAALVFVLPSNDYPSVEGDVNLYDVAWDQAEIDVLESYVAGGGLLVLANSALMRDFVNRPIHANEDWSDMNDLAGRFGVTFKAGRVATDHVMPQADTPVTGGITWLTLFPDSTVPFEITEGHVLASAGNKNLIAQIPHGDGEVLVFADMGFFASLYAETPPNLPFWVNLAAYAMGR